MMSNVGIDFTKVESLRKHMILTGGDMASLLGVTRMTYHRWVQGRVPPPRYNSKIKLVLKNLLSIMVDDKWPTPDVIIMDSKTRRAKLDTFLERSN